MRVEPLIGVVMPRGRRWVLLRDFDPDHLKTFNTKLDEAAALQGRCVENEPVAVLVQDKIPAAARLSSPSTPDVIEADHVQVVTREMCVGIWSG